MKRSMYLPSTLIAICLAVGAATSAHATEKATAQPAWSINATVIEACSCPMFCQCFFNSRPAEHGHAGHGDGEHFCRFNNAYKVNRGSYGPVKLDGAKFWLAGDLGDEDFSKAQGRWAVLTVDESATAEQREALEAIAKHLIPVTWNSFVTARGKIGWEYDKDSAHATIDGGKTAEVKLKRTAGVTDDPVVIHNLKYWGTQKNDGFVLMPNEVEAYRVGDHKFEYKGTNGFMLTFDLDSGDTTKTARAD